MVLLILPAIWLGQRITAYVELIAQRPPAILDISTLHNCMSDGYPHPTIAWRHENNAILPANEFPLECPLFVLDC